MGHSSRELNEITFKINPTVKKSNCAVIILCQTDAGISIDIDTWIAVHLTHEVILSRIPT